MTQKKACLLQNWSFENYCQKAFIFSSVIRQRPHWDQNLYKVAFKFYVKCDDFHLTDLWPSSLFQENQSVGKYFFNCEDCKLKIRIKILEFVKRMSYEDSKKCCLHLQTHLMFCMYFAKIHECFSLISLYSKKRWLTLLTSLFH